MAGVHITGGDAGYELLVAMRFLIAGTATMKSRYRVSFLGYQWLSAGEQFLQCAVM